MSKPRVPVYLALLLSAVLLTVQFGALAHGVEHLWHEHEEVCDVYLAAEHQGHALLSLDIPPVLPIFHTRPSAPCAVSFFLSPFRAFQARAPPFVVFSV